MEGIKYLFRPLYLILLIVYGICFNVIYFNTLEHSFWFRALSLIGVTLPFLYILFQLEKKKSQSQKKEKVYKVNNINNVK